jgi:Flp pilus assembly protein TadD
VSDPPSEPQALRLRGLAALEEGRAEDAAELIGRAAAADPENADMQTTLGIALARAGRAMAALEAYGRALAIDPDHSQALFNTACLLGNLGRLEEAAREHGRVVELNPHNPHAQYMLGATLQALGRLSEAAGAYGEAARLQPAMLAAHVQGAGVLLMLGQFEDALEACDRALGLDAGQAAIWSNRGAALLALNRPREALPAFERAIALDPAFPAGPANRGVALRELNRVEEARASFEQALVLAPDYVEARCNLGVCHLLTGDLEQGFAGHELRWLIEPGLSQRRSFDAPQWNGEDVAGRTILLHAEQGFGDTINFCRYAPLLAARGARVVLEVQPPLKTLMESLDGVSELLVRGDTLPAFDYHCPLMSLPAAFATRLESIPAPSAYLSASPERLALWRGRIGPPRGFRLGVVWSGKPTHHNDHNRSIPLEQFLRALPEGIEIFSLHDRVRDADAEVLARHPRIRRFDGQISDFADTAALAAAMDLVVSVDTSSAHLAAAIGRPTWVLLPFAPDWRWLLGRDDSPWYPGVRLFRQPALGDWDEVLRRVNEAIASLIRAHDGRSAPMAAEVYRG